MKRIVGIGLMFFVGLITQASTFIDGMYYNLNESALTAQLTYASGTFGGYAGEVIIPSKIEYNGNVYVVNSINDRCFYNCNNISSITIPATIKSITGTSTFYGCRGIKNVIIEDCDDPITIAGCKYNTEIGNTEATFHFSKLENLYVGRSIVYTGVSNSESPFSNQTKLSNVIVGDKVKQLPNGFIYGSSITHIKLPDGLKSIGIYAFGFCENLEELVIPSSVTSLGYNMCYSSGIKELYIGDGVEILSHGICSSCDNLQNVYLGSSITSFERATFNNCTNLKYIYLFSDNVVNLEGNSIPNTVSKIYVPNPSRYDNLLKDYYRDYLIVINNTINEYSGKAPLFSYKNNVEGSDVSFDSPDLNINVGEYNTNIDVNFKIGEWQSIAKVPANYSITPANLTIIASDASRQYGEDNPEFTCSYFGFKNNETRDVLTTQPKIETTATRESNVGTYPIIPFGAEAQNYTFTYERGKLNVTKADQEISWNQDFSDVRVGDIVELTAESSSGLAIKYTSTDETIAEIFTQNGKKHVEFLKDGNVSIRANQEGNENYNEADRVSKSIEIKSMSGINDVELDNRSNIDIYNCNGVILHKSVPREVLKSLTPGLYIIIQNGNAEKIMIQ